MSPYRTYEQKKPSRWKRIRDWLLSLPEGVYATILMIPLVIMLGILLFHAISRKPAYDRSANCTAVCSTLKGLAVYEGDSCACIIKDKEQRPTLVHFKYDYSSAEVSKLYTPRY